MLLMASACSTSSVPVTWQAPAYDVEHAMSGRPFSHNNPHRNEFVYARVVVGSGRNAADVVTVFNARDAKPLRTIGWEFPSASIMAVSPSGNLFVGHNGGHPFVVEYSRGGATILRRIRTPGTETIDQLSFDKRGDIYVEEQVPFAIYMYSPTGKLLATEKNEPYPSGFALDDVGNLYRGNCCYIKASPHAFINAFEHGSLRFIRQFQASDKWSPVQLAFDADTLFVVNVLNRFPYRSTRAQLSEYQDSKTKPAVTFAIPDSKDVGPSKLLISDQRAYVLYSKGFAEGAFVISASFSGKSLKRLSLDGTSNPVDMSFGASGLLYVADQPTATTGRINVYANGTKASSIITVACHSGKPTLDCHDAPVFSVAVGPI